MKRILLCISGVLALFMVEATSHAISAEKAYCYECVQRNGYMDCMAPVASGHVSCIPYASTCSVGAQCGSALRQLRVTADGSFLNSMLLDPVLAREAAEDGDQLALESGSGVESVKTCLGLVAARSYSPSRSLEIDMASKQIAI